MSLNNIVASYEAISVPKGKERDIAVDLGLAGFFVGETRDCIVEVLTKDLDRREIADLQSMLSKYGAEMPASFSADQQVN